VRWWREFKVAGDALGGGVAVAADVDADDLLLDVRRDLVDLEALLLLAVG
jgi:hypothetical protein